MKKVAFYINPQEGWLGGVHYYKNLFLALSLLEANRYEYFIFLPCHAKTFGFEVTGLQNIIYDDAFLIDFRGTLTYYIDKYEIDILSHMGIFSDVFGCKIVNWIPDFQHKHLPEFFSEDDLRQRDEKFELYARYADIVMLSSQNAMNDFSNFFPDYKRKSRVLQFVSSVDIDSLARDVSVLEENGQNEAKYFFLPNQFWQHKNHIAVFQAVAKLKHQGVGVTVLCSGFMDDFRNHDHMNRLREFVLDNQLEENVKFLGVVSHQRLYELMWKSIAVINPSLFEGWSTTVEECKTLEKVMIVSNLQVHKEQNPQAVYFEPHDIDGLAKIMDEMWRYDPKNAVLDVSGLKQKLLFRLINFGQEFETILDHALLAEGTL